MLDVNLSATCTISLIWINLRVLICCLSEFSEADEHGIKCPGDGRDVSVKERTHHFLELHSKTRQRLGNI